MASRSFNYTGGSNGSSTISRSPNNLFQQAQGVQWTIPANGTPTRMYYTFSFTGAGGVAESGYVSSTESWIAVTKFSPNPEAVYTYDVPVQVGTSGISPLLYWGVSQKAPKGGSFINVTFVVEYTESISGSIVRVSDCVLGDAAVLNLSNTNLSSVKHSVTWSLGEQYASSIELGVGQSTALLMCPGTWSGGITNGRSAVVNVTVVTMTVDGVKIAEQTGITFNLTIPSSSTDAYLPRIVSFTADPLMNGEVDENSEAFLQNLSGVRLTVKATADGGASVAKIYISGTGGYSAILTDGITYDAESKEYTAVYDVSCLTTAGTLRFTTTATDSRGLSSSATDIMILCIPYNEPGLNSISVYRADSDGKANGSGDSLAVVIDPVINTDSMDLNNSLQLVKIQYMAAGGETWSDAYTLSGANASGRDYTIPFLLDEEHTGTAIDMTMSYDFKITIADKVSEVVFTYTFDNQRYIVHLYREGRGIGIGQAYTKTGEQAVEINKNWNFYVHGYEIKRLIASYATTGTFIGDDDSIMGWSPDDVDDAIKALAYTKSQIDSLLSNITSGVSGYETNINNSMSAFQSTVNSALSSYESSIDTKLADYEKKADLNTDIAAYLATTAGKKMLMNIAHPVGCYVMVPSGVSVTSIYPIEGATWASRDPVGSYMVYQRTA